MIKELVVVSGKGGTGKTSITAAFASLCKHGVFCDADVDAADLHLILKPDIQKKSDFTGGHEAIIDSDNCSQCGLCIDLCRFDAISNTYEVDPVACEGCGVCVDLCPENAIDFPETICGQWFISDTRFGPMVHARLGIAQENSGKLVSLVRKESRVLSEKNNFEFILTDGPPGVGCPVIASIGQASCLLIISEPTVSGLHDLERVVKLAAHFNIPAMVCINKYDLNLIQTINIEKYAENNNLTVVGKIPFDSNFTRSMIEEKTIFEYDNHSQASIVLRLIWDTILSQPIFEAPVARIL